MSVSVEEAAAAWKQLTSFRKALWEWKCESYNKTETDWCESYLGHRGQHKGRMTGVRWGKAR